MVAVVDLIFTGLSQLLPLTLSLRPATHCGEQLTLSDAQSVPLQNHAQCVQIYICEAIST